MRLILDTHLLIWLSQLQAPASRPRALFELLEEPDHELWFSAVSIWEVAIKFVRGRPDFSLRPDALKGALLRSGYRELAVTSEHAIAVAGLPPLHGDPFDRLLIAQAISEGLTLVTGDAQVARYPGPILRV